MALIDQYVRLFKSLLPQGKAWPRDVETNLHDLIEGIAAEFVRVHERGEALMREADPRQTLELLEDWEKAFGLPDACALESGGIPERRQQLFHKIVTGGGQSRAFYIQIAAQFGYDVTITEYRRFRAGKSRSGDRCYGLYWKFYWQVNAADFQITRFRVGQSHAGERLATWSNDTLECIFQRLRPAHTEVRFSYGS